MNYMSGCCMLQLTLLSIQSQITFDNIHGFVLLTLQVLKRLYRHDCKIIVKDYANIYIYLPCNAVKCQFDSCTEL